MSTDKSTVNASVEKVIAPIWRQAFRPFFLAGSLFSILAVAAWIAVINGHLVFMPYANTIFWHGHEMLFGFVSAIVVGFLLTAVQSWTGLRATHGKTLMALFLLWLIARLLMVVGTSELGWAVAVVDVSLLPAAAALVAQLVIKARSYRNLQFIPVLGLLAVANLLTHLSVILNKPMLFTWGIYAAIMLVSVLMIVIGGRVIPLFTASGTHTPAVTPKPWLENTVLISTWLVALGFISNSVLILPDKLLATIFAIAALSNACRVARWRGWTALSQPLVWSLHLAYCFIPVGFGLFALHYVGLGINATTALHSLTAGAMGSLILAMIARVSLGHSGRPLIVHPSMKIAFLFIAAAGITRLLVGIYPATFTNSGYVISATFWAFAYGIYFFVYFKILTTQRPDGKPG